MQIVQLTDRAHTERCFNLFVYVENDVIYELGGYFHKLGGGDAEKMAGLQARMREDLSRARRYPVPSRFVAFGPVACAQKAGALSYETFKALSGQNIHMELFEHVLVALGAGRIPMLCITPVVGGEIPPLATVPTPMPSGSRQK